MEQLATDLKALDGMRCTFTKIFALVAWDRERSAPLYQGDLICDDWEVAETELVFEPDS